MSFYEMVKDNPQFKRYCARQSTRPIAKPKRFKVPIPKPKGMLSVLGEYTTGRMIRCGDMRYHYDSSLPDGKGAEKELHYYTIAETAILKRINGEFISVVNNPGDCPVETVSQKPCENWIFGIDTPDKPDEPDEEPAEDIIDEPQSSQDDDSGVMKLIVALEQQNALLRQLAARV